MDISSIIIIPAMRQIAPLEAVGRLLTLWREWPRNVWYSWISI